MKENKEKNIDPKYTWDLTDIYKSVEEFEKDVDKIVEIKKEYLTFRGKLNTKEALIKESLLARELSKIDEKVCAYTFLKNSLDMKDDEAQELSTKVYLKIDKIDKKLNFVIPEILKNDEKLLLEVANDPRMKEARRGYLKLIERKKHFLTEREEYILDRALSGNAVTTIYDLHDNDLEFKDAEDSNGKKHKVTHTNTAELFDSKDPLLRKNTFDSVYETYKKHIYPIGEMYLSFIKTRKEVLELRNYSSVLESVVISDDSNEKVYNTLLNAINNNMWIADKVVDTIKKAQNLPTFNRWDFGYNPFKKENKKYTYEESKKIVKEALSVLGKDYIAKLDEAFENRWIDVYPKKNKDTGAYSYGLYGVHPFVLLNFEGEFDDISTMAHELGHAMHSYLSSKYQDISNSNYTLMVAEVASTVNEMLLAEYLLNNETDLEKKKYILLEQIHTINGTLLRQTMFAEFEKIMADKMQNDEVLTTKKINEIYLGLCKKYFKNIENLDERIQYEWARVPHFYSSFYVYKYATGITAAIIIAQNILEQGEEYLEKYFEMLKSGNLYDSIETLKIAEVDLEDENTYLKAINFLNDRLDQLSNLL